MHALWSSGWMRTSSRTLNAPGRLRNSSYFLAIILNLAATATPQWYQAIDSINGNRYIRNFGFFASQVCLDGECVSLSEDHLETFCGSTWRRVWPDSCKHYDGIRATLVIGCIIGLLGFTTFAVSLLRRGSKVVRPWVIASMVFAVIVAGLGFTAMCLAVEMKSGAGFGRYQRVDLGPSFG
ncbi:hypothetical protein BC829DRAFT_492212 [Chytridium lagenaria]|nr:hypothetical protein BC829DRAFT_492212 [Chytridium lagenaria]